MTYNAQGIGKSGARKRLVEEVIKYVEMRQVGLRDEYCMAQIEACVEQYKKETSK